MEFSKRLNMYLATLYHMRKVRAIAGLGHLDAKEKRRALSRTIAAVVVIIILAAGVVGLYTISSPGKSSTTSSSATSASTSSAASSGSSTLATSSTLSTTAASNTTATAIPLSLSLGRVPPPRPSTRPMVTSM